VSGTRRVLAHSFRHLCDVRARFAICCFSRERAVHAGRLRPRFGRGSALGVGRAQRGGFCELFETSEACRIWAHEPLTGAASIVGFSCQRVIAYERRIECVEESARVPHESSRRPRIVSTTRQSRYADADGRHGVSSAKLGSRARNVSRKRAGRALSQKAWSSGLARSRFTPNGFASSSSPLLRTSPPPSWVGVSRSSLIARLASDAQIRVWDRGVEKRALECVVRFRTLGNPRGSSWFFFVRTRKASWSVFSALLLRFGAPLVRRGPFVQAQSQLGFQQHSASAQSRTRTPSRKSRARASLVPVRRLSLLVRYVGGARGGFLRTHPRLSRLAVLVFVAIPQRQENHVAYVFRA